MSEFVVWFDSSETGAPVLNNAAGSLIALLDACLVTGFNTRAITSLVVAGGVATATAAGHGFSAAYGKDLLLAGATPAGLNGRKALTYVDTNTFKFDATGISDQTATGTITAKRDPLGWVKQFTGTNKAIYKRSDLTATNMMLRVLDTAAAPASGYSARVSMIESATDIDTISGVSPSTAQVTDGYGHWWSKGTNNTTAKQWSLVGDGKSFYLSTQSSSGLLPSAGSFALSYYFGDFTSLKQGDAYNCLLTGSVTDPNANYAGYEILGIYSGFGGSNGGGVIARGFGQVGSAVKMSFGGITQNASGHSSFPAYPSPVDSGMVVSPNALVIENSGSSYPVRGFLHGMVQFLASAPLNHFDIISPVATMPGRSLQVNAWMQGGSPIRVGLDLTGPWG